ncbi:transport protein Trs120 or TRAPPC9 TRAPP II complex subunit-domain-containing protein [Entophlyctis helioformis]|nr:transport protein Trs120 or TRAPPC9 TRAPP II complex subunit-domain-containing protein [Entophlyctis helioformis]
MSGSGNAAQGQGPGMAPGPGPAPGEGEGASPLLGLAQITILVVPVHPIRRDTFQTYLHLLAQFGSVCLQDLTPPDAKSAKFTEQLYHDGFIHFNFVTSYNRDHAPLEDIQLNRQVLGVIGIMHCQQSPDLAQGLKRFQQIVQRYPTALAYRCFGFEPSESQADDTKGLIMIPNVGDISFYLQTMINDFTADLLIAVGSLAGQIERRTMISGPLMMSPLIQGSGPSGSSGSSGQSASLSGASAGQSAMASGRQGGAGNATPTAMSAAMGSPSLAPLTLATAGLSAAGGAGATSANATTTLAPPTPAASSAFAGPTPPPFAHFSGPTTPVMDRTRESSAGNLLSNEPNAAGGPSASIGMGLHAATPGTMSSLVMPGMSSSTHGPMITTSTVAATSVSNASGGASANPLASMGASGMNLGFGLGSILNPDKTRKRTPARVHKLLGDLYLMAGRLDIALASYQSALDGTRANSDYQWQAAALESQCCAQLLRLVSEAGLGPMRSGDAPSPTSALSPSSHADRSAARSSLNVYGSLPSTSDILHYAATKQSKDLLLFLLELPDRAREIVQLYDRAYAVGVPGFYPILQIQTALKMAGVLAAVYSSRLLFAFGNGAGVAYWAAESKGLGAEIAARIGNTGGGSGGGGGGGSGGTGALAGIGGGSGATATGAGGTQGLPSMVQADRILLQGGQGASRVDVVSWVMRAWHSGHEYLQLGDQVATCAAMAAICGQVGAHRKHAFFLRHTACFGAALMARAPAGSSNANSLVSAQGHRLRDMHSSSAPLECLKRVCDLLGLHDASSGKGRPRGAEARGDDDDDTWLEEYEDESDLDAGPAAATAATAATTRGSSTPALILTSAATSGANMQPTRVMTPTLRHGWPSLQIGILKECIHVAQTQGDHFNTVMYVSRALRYLYRHLSRRDQLALADILTQVVVVKQSRSTVDGHDDATVDAQTDAQPDAAPDTDAAPDSLDARVSTSRDSVARPIVSAPAGRVLGAPVLRRITPIKQPARQQPVARPRPNADGSPAAAAPAAPKSVFIYNPYADRAHGGSGPGKGTGGGTGPGAGAGAGSAKQRTKPDVVLVDGEMAYFDVVLANPFAFDLDLPKLALSTSGIPFRAVPISTLVPAGARAHVVRLAGLPTGDGELHVHGVSVRSVGGCIAEDVAPVWSGLVGQPGGRRRVGKDGRRVKQNDRGRYGKRVIEFLGSGSGGGGGGDDASAGEGETVRWSLPITVVPALPMLQVSRTSLGVHQASMLFEGERSTFTATIRNIGSVAVDYLYVNVVENMAAPTGPRLGFLDAYEADIQNRSVRAFWIQSPATGTGTGTVALNGDRLAADQSVYAVFSKIGDQRGERVDVRLGPGETLDISFGVYGKRDCIGAAIQIEYAQLDGSVDQTMYIRQIVLPVLLTVHPVLTTHNVDFLLHGHDDHALRSNHHHHQQQQQQQQQQQEAGGLVGGHQRAESAGELVLEPRLSDAVLDAIPDDDSHRATFVFTFDIHNAWNEPFSVQFDVYSDDETESPKTYSSLIHAGVAKRIILPLPRMRLGKAVVETEVPTPEWKQYIKSSETMSPEDEALRRAVFWYREHLVGGVRGRGRVVGRWFCSRDRQGLLNLRGFTLTERMLHVLKSDSIGLAPLLSGDHAVRVRPDFYTLRVHTCARLEWRITNLKNLYLRILPVQEDSHSVISTAVAPYMHISGATTVALPVLAPGASHTHAITIRPATLARLRFVCHVEEIHRPAKPSASVAVKKSKYDVAPVVLGHIEKIHWDRDGVVVVAVE